MGIHLAAGVAYLALVVRPDRVSLEGAAKFAPAANVDKWIGLRQFGERLVTEVRAYNVVCVAFAEPRKYNDWKYYDAFTRASYQVAGALALQAASVPVREVPQQSAAKTLGLKAGDLEERLAEKLGLDAGSVVHWKQRVPSIAVAVHVARELWA